MPTAMSTGNNNATMLGCLFRRLLHLCLLPPCFSLWSLSPFCFWRRVAYPSPCATAESAIGGTRDGLTRKTLGSIKIVNNRKTIIKPNCASIEASCVYRSVETSRRRRRNPPKHNTKWPNCSFSLLALQPWRQPRHTPPPRRSNSTSCSD